jgi:hypothetical protein
MLGQSEKPLVQFYQGQITRGEYNTARKELSARAHGWSMK